MKMQMTLSLMTLVLALSAHAESKRFLVVMKSQQSYQALSQETALKKNRFGLPGQNGAVISGRVEQRLNNLNTFVIKMDEREAALLQSHPNVAMIEAEILHPAPQPVRGLGTLGSPQPSLQRVSPYLLKSTVFEAGPKTPWGIHAVKAMDAWGQSNAGEGVRVLVLDTGVDKDHPALAPNFEKGQNFVADTPTTPYNFADTIGHGTHVSGTIAAAQGEGGFTGVAPRARLLAGRVCAKNGCSNVSIAAGVNWGIAEKVDVISMSLGGMWSTPAEQEAIRKAVASGITVVAASGNDGTGRVSYPAALPQAIAVGAVDIKLQKATFSQYGRELAVVAPGVDVASSVPMGTGREADVQISAPTRNEKLMSTTFDGSADVTDAIQGDLVFAGLGKPEDFTNLDVKGKIVLMARGEVTFAIKAKNALDAGAAGAIVYNNVEGALHGTLSQDGTKMGISVFGIELSMGEKLKAALAGGEAIKSRLAVLVTDYSNMDGTSMATPHVSGVVALIKSANKGLLPSQVKQILQQSAKPLGPNTNNEYGAGVIQADAAVQLALTTAAEPLPVVEEQPAPQQPVVAPIETPAPPAPPVQP